MLTHIYSAFSALTHCGLGMPYGNIPDSQVHGANMGPNWVLSAPDGPHVDPMNLASGDILCFHMASQGHNELRHWMQNLASSLVGLIMYSTESNMFPVAQLARYTWPSGGLSTNCEEEAKWPPFCRRHSRLNFLVWTLFNFDKNFTEICFQGSN